MDSSYRFNVDLSSPYLTQVHFFEVPECTFLCGPIDQVMKLVVFPKPLCREGDLVLSRKDRLEMVFLPPL